MNIRLPDDYAAYGRYMAACAKALLDAFGHEELLKWHFAVLTELVNFSPSHNPLKSSAIFSMVTGFRSNMSKPWSL